MAVRTLARVTDRARRTAGRPRDATIDERALDAARRLLVEAGYAGTTVQAVAKRSGVHASAIYRRWPTRLALVQAAAFADLPPGRVRPTGDLRRDLIGFTRAYVRTFEAPVVRAALPGLVAGMAADPDASWEVLARLSVRPQFRDLLAAAPAGAVDPDVDVDQVFDLLLGAVLVGVLVPGGVRPPPPVEATVDLLLRILRPGPAAGSGG